MSALKNLAWPASALLALIALWQIGVMVFGPPPYLVPAPAHVVAAFQENWAILSTAALITLRAAVFAFLLAALIGAVVALLLSSIPFLYKAFFPYTVVLQTIPVIAVAPIVIIWFGIGLPSIIAIGILIAVFPVIANTTIGLRSTDASLKQLFTFYGATPVQSLFKLRLPYSLPFFFTGLRIASGLAVIGVIVGEYFAGAGGNRAGLGFVLVNAASRLQMPTLFAATICSGVVGIALFAVVSVLSNYFLQSWHESVRE